MSEKKPKVSKSGAVGNNMPKALKGEVGGSISKNYEGRPRNAKPDHPHKPENAQPVKDWTVNHMQEARKNKK
jgi:hypothetical protein